MRTRITRRAVRSPLLAIALVAAFAGTAVATGATGFSATPLARGTLSTNVHFNTGEVKLQTKGDVDVVHSMVTIQPNGSSGWHTHPGIVLVTVASGSLTFYDDQCQATEHPAGSSFVESGDDAGLVRNLSSSVTATVYATYLVPVGTTVLRIDKPNPGLPAVLTAPSRTAGTFLRERPRFAIPARPHRAGGFRARDQPPDTGSAMVGPKKIEPGRRIGPQYGRTGAPLSVDQGRCRWIAISLRRLAAGIGRHTPT